MPIRANIAASLLLLAAMPAPAMSAGKCWASRTTICNGCSVTMEWQVALAPAGPAAAHAFCRNSWANLGGHIHFDVVQPPHAGTVRVRDYAVFYRGERPGHDTMTLRATWYGRSNDVRSGTLTYDINVVGGG